MIKAVLFDMDGVLIDSVQVGLRVRKRLLAQYGIDLDTVPDPQGESHRAASMKALLASVEHHTGLHIDPEEFAKLSLAEMRQELLAAGITADPHLVLLLQELKKHGIACAVASSSLRPAIDNKLNVLGIKEYFSVIITGSDVKEHKPSPETYLLAAAKLDVPPEDCLVIEDTVTGVRAGVAAGCRVIGFAQYNPPKEPLPGVVMTAKHWRDISYKKILGLS